MKQYVSKLTRNYPTKVIALMLAIAIWVIAYTDNNRGVAAPKVDTMIQMQLEFKNIPSEMHVADRQYQITAHVKSTQEQQNTICDDISCFVDLTGERAGQRNLYVQTVLPQGVELVSVEPERVVVNLQKIETEMFSVQPAVSSDSGKTMLLGNFTVIPEYVTIEGTSQMLSDIDRVIVLTDMNDNETSLCDILVLDEHGNSLNDAVNIYPDSVTIKSSTFDTSYLKKVTVHARVATSGDADFNIERIELSKQEVVICSKPEVIANITNIQTKTVIIDKIGNNVYKAELDLPEGVFAPDGNEIELIVTTSEN